MTWRVEVVEARVAEIHGLDLNQRTERTAVICRPTDRAIVLGSTQDDAIVDRAVAKSWEVDVVRRRTGGGAVLVEPGDLAWIEIVVPRGDELWDDDVGRASHWVGEVWATALGGDVHVHRGPMVTTAWSSAVCFAGLGPGEVTARVGGGPWGKVVGVSQRRTRTSARFSTAALVHWRPERIASLLAVPAADLGRVAHGLAGQVDELESAFRAVLSQRGSTVGEER